MDWDVWDDAAVDEADAARRLAAIPVTVPLYGATFGFYVVLLALSLASGLVLSLAFERPFMKLRPLLEEAAHAATARLRRSP